MEIYLRQTAGEWLEAAQDFFVYEEDFWQLHYIVPCVAALAIATYSFYHWAPIRARVGEAVASFVSGGVTATLVICAVLAMGNYFHFGDHPHRDVQGDDTYLNGYEFYHYYIGSKYAREILYYNLYAASLIADEETGLKYNNPKGTIKNLRYSSRIDVDKVLGREPMGTRSVEVDGETVQVPEHDTRQEIKASFSPERWDAFRRDTEYFKHMLTQSRWNAVLSDKGYNTTPVWGMIVGGLLSNTFGTPEVPRDGSPPGQGFKSIFDEPGMTFLALLDVFLIAIAAGCVWWAFGHRPMLLMITLLGTAYVMKFSHMKGAYLRTDFAMSMIMACCMLKKKQYSLGGFFAAYAFLSRVFPAAFLFALGVKGLADFARHPIAYVQLARYAVARPFVWTFRATTWLLARTGRTDSSNGPSGIEHDVTGEGAAASVPFAAMHNHDWRYVRFFAVAGATVVVLVGASWFYHGGRTLDRDADGLLDTFLLNEYWAQFAEKIVDHNSQVSPWRVGFKYLFTSSFDARNSTPIWEMDASFFAPSNWLDTFANSTPFIRGAIYEQHEAFFWQIVGVVLLICVPLVLPLKDEELIPFSFVAIYFASASTYYYFVMLLIPLLFFTPYLEKPGRALGAILLLLSAIPGYYWYANMGWRQKFPTYYYHSLMYLGIVLYMGIAASGAWLPVLLGRRSISGADVIDRAPQPEEAAAPDATPAFARAAASPDTAPFPESLELAGAGPSQRAPAPPFSTQGMISAALVRLQDAPIGWVFGGRKDEDAAAERANDAEEEAASIERQRIPWIRRQRARRSRRMG